MNDINPLANVANYFSLQLVVSTNFYGISWTLWKDHKAAI